MTQNRGPRSWCAIPAPSSSLATIPGRLPHSRRTIDHEMAKVMKRSEAETERRKAVEFLQRIGKPEDAEWFEAMSPEQYAAHQHSELMANPLRRYRIMAQEAGPTKAELTERIDDIEDLLEEALDPELTREELVSKVKEIQTVASGEAEEDETDLESDEDIDDGECDDEDD